MGLPARLSPSALPALQRALGNRMIAEVLAAESHRHGDDCDHSAPATRTAATRPAPEPPAHGAAAVQRALVSQVESTSDDGRTVKVQALNIIGRPDSPFSGTMGDHSTAFAVQVEAVRRRVVGQTAAAAVLGAAGAGQEGRLSPSRGYPGYGANSWAKTSRPSLRYSRWTASTRSAVLTARPASAAR